MPVMLSLSVACAAMACGPVDPKDDADATVKEAVVEQGVVTKAVETAEASAEQPAGPSDVKVVTFDGGHDFLKTSRRLRIWRAEVSFDMTVDAQGEATQCDVVHRFRKTYVNKKLCEVVMAHYTFEPARNAQNEAVEGSYRARISYKDLIEELD